MRHCSPLMRPDRYPCQIRSRLDHARPERVKRPIDIATCEMLSHLVKRSLVTVFEVASRRYQPRQCAALSPAVLRDRAWSPPAAPGWFSPLVCLFDLRVIPCLPLRRRLAARSAASAPPVSAPSAAVRLRSSRFLCTRHWHVRLLLPDAAILRPRRPLPTARPHCMPIQ